jgi:hypothetical protein|tara:strand:- start:10560 stop:10811 length:252 start_codon:yes stop_codon:yes gene_type:complete
MKIIIIKGNEATAGTTLGAATTVDNAKLVKFYHTAAAVVTLVDSANTAIGNTSVDAGIHYFHKKAEDKLFASAGLVTSVGYGD